MQFLKKIIIFSNKLIWNFDACETFHATVPEKMPIILQDSNNIQEP